VTDSELSHNAAPSVPPTGRFAARELSPDPQPVHPSLLVEESVYFCVNYVDTDELIPTLETVVYIGREVGQDAGKLLFQDVDSYREGVRYGTDAAEAHGTFVARPERDLTDVFDYERAVEELMRCSLRRRGIL
jgi:hypothetical protein